jgi:hypothetical protein
MRKRHAFSKQRLERVMGIEPTSSAWEADALPLCYTRARDGTPRILQSSQFKSSTENKT